MTQEQDPPKPLDVLNAEIKDGVDRLETSAKMLREMCVKDIRAVYEQVFIQMEAGAEPYGLLLAAEQALRSNLKHLVECHKAVLQAKRMEPVIMRISDTGEVTRPSSSGG